MTLTVLLVSVNEDFIACKNYCNKCFEEKLNLKVLRKFDYEDEQELIFWEPIKKIKLICICKKPPKK